MGVERLKESITEFERIDREAGVIRGVKIIQPVSKNGRRYLTEALRKAAPMYEGKRVYLDHLSPDSKTKQRKKGDRWGKLVGVAESNGLTADLHYLKNHPLTEAILESIERFGDTGLSHDAEGAVERRGGETVVTEIVEVHSVDFVEEAATNRNLFESYEGRPMKKKVLAVLREGIGSDESVRRCLARLAESDNAAELEALEFAPADEATDEQLVSQAGASLVSALFEGKTFGEGVDQLRSLLAIHREDASGDSEGGSGSTGGSHESQALIESLQRELSEIKEERKREKDELSCQKLLESSGVDMSDAAKNQKRLKFLMSVPEDQRQALVEEFPKAKRRPTHSPGVTTLINEGADSAKIPENFDLKKALQSI